MRISHKHKYVFISTPKTASTSIREALNDTMQISPDPYPAPPPGKRCPFHQYHKFYDPSFETHATALDLKNRFIEEGWNWDDYFVFGFTRNPWDREVSNYEYKKRCIQKWTFEREGGQEWAEYCIKELNEYKNFLNYIKNKRLLTPNMSWFLDEEGNNLASKIYKYESLQEGFNDACKTIGIPEKELGFAGFSGRRSTRDDKSPKFYFTYHKYYDQEAADVVAEHYKQDIEHLGYKYE